jgi:hypothetical protein
MRPFRATPANSYDSTSIHPALNGFAAECSATLMRLMAYVGVLGLLAMAGLHFWNELPDAPPPEPAAKAGWSLASRSHPAFAVSSLDLSDKTETYEIFRHPAGGRKDVLHWMAPGTASGTALAGKPIAELEIYRPGGEFDPSDAANAELAARMDPQRNPKGNPRGNPKGDPKGSPGLEAAGIIDSKFGAVALLRPSSDASGARNQATPCLGFVKRLGDPNLQISGWTCQGDGLPAQRAAIGCMLNRLTLLSAGNEPKLAELFARAELKRGSCATTAPSTTSVDWVTGIANPRLRGPL